MLQFIISNGLNTVNHRYTILYLHNIIANRIGRHSNTPRHRLCILKYNPFSGHLSLLVRISPFQTSAIEFHVLFKPTIRLYLFSGLFFTNFCRPMQYYFYAVSGIHRNLRNLYETIVGFSRYLRAVFSLAINIFCLFDKITQHQPKIFNINVFTISYIIKLFERRCVTLDDKNGTGYNRVWYPHIPDQNALPRIPFHPLIIIIRPNFLLLVIHASR